MLSYLIFIQTEVFREVPHRGFLPENNSHLETSRRTSGEAINTGKLMIEILDRISFDVKET